MVQGTANVIEAAQASGARRFVFMSALGVDSQTKDAVPYYAAKWACEAAVRESGLSHTILRPSFVFGRDGGALPRFVRIARLAPVTPVVAPGTQRLQPIWVDDLARAVVPARGAMTISSSSSAARTSSTGTSSGARSRRRSGPAGRRSTSRPR